MKTKFQTNLSLIFAVASKDIGDAIRNRVILAIFLSVGFMVVSTQALPWLVSLKKRSIVFYYDQGTSQTIKNAQRNQQDLILAPESSLDSLLDAVGQTAENALGVIFPPDFDQVLASGETLSLIAYYPFHSAPKDIFAMEMDIEGKLSQVLNTPTDLLLEGHPAYPLTVSKGYPQMIAFGMVLGVTTLGMILTPYLFIEERETKTMDALLLSPIKIHHVIIGKTLTGLVYSVAAALPIFLLSWRWIVHWDLIMLTLLLSAITGVAIGLVIGVLFDNSSTTNMIAGLGIATLSIPMYIWHTLAGKVSPVVLNLISWLPSISMYKLSHLSMTQQPAFTIILPLIGKLVVVILGLFALVSWRLFADQRK